MAQVDELGGPWLLLKRVFIQKEIEQRAYTLQREIEEINGSWWA